LHDVCQKACAVNADSRQFPSDWLFHLRWGKGRHKNATKSAKKETIKEDEDEDEDDEDEVKVNRSNKTHDGPVTVDGHPITFETVGFQVVVVSLAKPMISTVDALALLCLQYSYRNCKPPSQGNPPNH
jgi:hypothetical protein